MHMWVGHLCLCVCVWFLHKNWLEIYKLKLFFGVFCFVARSENQIKIKLFAIVVGICTWKGRHMCTSVCASVCVWLLTFEYCQPYAELQVETLNVPSGETETDFVEKKKTKKKPSKIFPASNIVLYVASGAGFCHAQNYRCQLGNFVSQRTKLATCTSQK